jgi:hypothetical protein
MPFPIKSSGCKGLKASEPSSTPYFAPINPFDALSLADGKPGREEENDPGNNADHASRDTAGILKNRCPD